MSVGREFEIDCFPLIIVIVLNINGTMKNWLSNVHEEESWNHRECEPNPILGKPEVNCSISLEEMNRLPKSPGGWFV